MKVHILPGGPWINCEYKLGSYTNRNTQQSSDHALTSLVEVGIKGSLRSLLSSLELCIVSNDC